MTLAQVRSIDPNKVVITVGDRQITDAQFREFVALLPGNYPVSAEFSLIRLAIEAQQRSASDSGRSQAAPASPADLYRALQDMGPIDDAAIGKYYDEHKAEYETVRAQAIFVRVKGSRAPAVPGKPELTEEQAAGRARELRARLLAGEDFATVARAESDDPVSGPRGGNLGEFKRRMMIPEFEEAAFAARVNEIGEPVKTPNGYFIIRVEGHTTPSLSDKRKDIAAILTRALIARLMKISGPSQLP